MLELSNKKKIKNILLVILFLILLGTSGYFGYEFFNKEECKEVECNPCEEEKDEIEEEVTEENDEVTVYEGANTISEYWADEGDNFKIILPQISGNSEVIKKMNKDIIEKVLSKSLTPFGDPDDKESEYPNSFKVSYDFKKDKDILYLVLTINFSPWNASGSGMFVYNYTYDIKNDKEISLFDALKLLGKTEDELIKADSWCNMDRKCKKSDLVEYMTNDYGVYYYLENGKFKFNYFSN